MKIAIWAMVAVIALGAIGGAVYLGTRDMGSKPGNQQNTKPINNPEPSSGKQTYQLKVDGVNREFIVYRPDDLKKTEEVPVVFMYHGSHGTGEKMYNETGWKEQADEGGFMVVYPTGLKYHVFDEEKVMKGELKTDVAAYSTKWSSYDLPNHFDESYPDQTAADDVKFTREMVDFLGENYAIDESRMYATGFSNGASFVSRLVVEMADVFAAFAPTGAGTIPDQVQAKIETDGLEITPRPIIQMLGAEDAKLTHSAGVEEFPTDESAAEDGSAVKEGYIDGFITFEGLADEYTYVDEGKAGHFTYDQSLKGANNEYQLIIVEGMGHIYPNGNNIRLDAAEIFWSFFEQYSL